MRTAAFIGMLPESWVIGMRVGVVIAIFAGSLNILTDVEMIVVVKYVVELTFAVEVLSD